MSNKLRIFTFLVGLYLLCFSLPGNSAEKLKITGTITGPTLFETSEKNTILEKDPSKKTVIVFLSAKCPCSNSHIDELKNLASLYPAFQFLAIHSNSDEPPDFSRPYFEKANLPFPIIEDPDQKLAETFHAFKTPHAFILAEDSEVLYQGGVSDSHEISKSKIKYLRQALQELTEKKSVSISQTRTLGCVIARKDKNVW